MTVEEKVKALVEETYDDVLDFCKKDKTVTVEYPMHELPEIEEEFKSDLFNRIFSAFRSQFEKKNLFVYKADCSSYSLQNNEGVFIISIKKDKKVDPSKMENQRIIAILDDQYLGKDE